MEFKITERGKFSRIYQTTAYLNVAVDEMGEKEVYEEVEAIMLRGRSNKISWFPIDLNKFFPNLKSLYISNQNVTSISRKDLTGLENLAELHMNDCKLKSIPSNLFDNMRKLKKVYFDNNDLGGITSDLLKSIVGNGLEEVDLRQNRNIDAFYSTREDGEEGGVSLQELMDLIDSQCTKPPEDPQIDNAYQAKCSEKFARLWTTKLRSDFKILTKNSAEIRVHKIVLMVSSPVLSSMLENDMQETNEGVLKIEDFEPEAVQHFFGFLYTGSIPCGDHAMELFTMADMYDVPELKSMSERLMFESINQSNALAVFNFAHLHSLINLKQAAFESIQEKFPDRELKRKWMEDPSSLKTVIEAEDNRKKETKQTQKKFNEVWDML